MNKVIPRIGKSNPVSLITMCLQCLDHRWKRMVFCDWNEDKCSMIKSVTIALSHCTDLDRALRIIENELYDWLKLRPRKYIVLTSETSFCKSNKCKNWDPQLKHLSASNIFCIVTFSPETTLNSNWYAKWVTMEWGTRSCSCVHGDFSR